MEHAADDEKCWCQPELFQVCPECYEHADPLPDCWRCKGHGIVPEYDPTRPALIMHRDIPERELL